MRPNPNASLVGNAGFRTSLNTPALGVDLDVMERNIRDMAELARSHGVALRPHAKAHKSSRVARMQLEAGAVGVCCATIGEAEVLAAGGVPDLLITAALSVAPKISRLAGLLAVAPRVCVVVDQIATVDALAAVAQRAERRLSVLIDVDVGQRRTGVTTPEVAVEIARRIAGSPALRLAGIQGYAGHLQALVPFEERAAKCAEVHEKLRAMRAHLERNGFPCEVVSGGGTGTALSDAASGIFTELQPGSYLYMDAQYEKVQIASSGPSRFPTGLRFFTRIISAPHPGFATTDGGTKAMAGDGPAAPRIVAGAPEGTVYKYSGDEFGRLEYADTSYQAQVGTLIECHVPHCDTSMGLHDHLLGFRGEKLETLWPIEARGSW
jgi:D-serine deaminase-like pyridoxal phosphate-dependent protein